MTEYSYSTAMSGKPLLQPQIDYNTHRFDEPTGLILPKEEARIYWEDEYILSYPGYEFINDDPHLAAYMTSPSNDKYKYYAAWYADNGGFKARKEKWYFEFCSYCKIEQRRALVAGYIFLVQMCCFLGYSEQISVRKIYKAIHSLFKKCDDISKNYGLPDLMDVYLPSLRDKKNKFPWSRGRWCYKDYDSVLHYWGALILCGYPEDDKDIYNNYIKFYSTAKTLYNLASNLHIKEFERLKLYGNNRFTIMPTANLTKLVDNKELFLAKMEELMTDYNNNKKYLELSSNRPKRKKKSKLRR